MVGVLVALVVVILVAGLGVARVRDAASVIRRARTTPTTAVAPSGTPAAPGGDELSAAQRQAVDQVKAQVAEIRGLPWKSDLPVKVVSRAELARRVKEQTAADAAKHRDRLAADESVLKLLQLIPKDVDYAKAVDDVLAGGVLGFYDDETHELFVGGDSGATIDVATRSVLSHELTHALTDQTFDFGPKTRALDSADRTEESAAFTAVIEGDAELVRALWEQRHLSADERAEAAGGSADSGGAYAKAPPYLLDALQFPYVHGVEFVRSRYKAGGFAEVDRAYLSPPTSTEQILHPELYAAGQGWTPPPFPDLQVATGCAKVVAGNLGEFDMSELLDRQLSTSDAAKGAAGWNGDTYGLVRCGTALGFADRWQTDAPADATRLRDALARWSRGWSGSNRAPDADGRFSGPSGSGRVAVAGGRVDLVLADDATTVDKLVRALAAS